MHTAADTDILAMDLQMPGFHDLVVRPERVELRLDEVSNVSSFELTVQNLGPVGAVIFAHVSTRWRDRATLAQGGGLGHTTAHARYTSLANFASIRALNGDPFRSPRNDRL